MSYDASDLARRLAHNAEAVCRRYLSNGRRKGRYWYVGDVRNTPGRSLFVRLEGPEFGQGAAGKWTDASTAEHGDLLDIIRETCGFAEFHEVADEARRFLSLPPVEHGAGMMRADAKEVPLSAPVGSAEAAQRLFSASQPIEGTIVETYLRHRDITVLTGVGALRFHPRCYYRPDSDAPAEERPAMIAAVTDLDGAITGVHRTWLDPSGRGKAHIDTPRRAMGHLVGNSVRFGTPQPIGTHTQVLAAGEGIETILSLRCALPAMPMMAALSAAHLAAIQFPASLRRLYIARDADPAGDHAVARLLERTREAGIEAVVLSTQLGDFNEDLAKHGLDELRAALWAQLAPEDVARFMDL